MLTLEEVEGNGAGTMRRGARMEAQALPPLKAQGSSAAAGCGSEGRRGGARSDRRREPHPRPSTPFTSLDVAERSQGP